MEPIINRSDIQDKLRELVLVNHNKDLVKLGVQVWLLDSNASDFQIKQIMNDLTSYKEYLELLN